LKRTGAGKSGSKMYWSADKQVIVKSLSPIEVSKGKYFMKDYCEVSFINYLRYNLLVHALG
jgi:hypothetical protein